MAVSSAAYTYKPLSPRTIRVIALEAALRIDDPIRCRLKDVSLDELSDASERGRVQQGAPVGSLIRVMEG